MAVKHSVSRAEHMYFLQTSGQLLFFHTYMHTHAHTERDCIRKIQLFKTIFKLKILQSLKHCQLSDICTLIT